MSWLRMLPRITIKLSQTFYHLHSPLRTFPHVLNFHEMSSEMDTFPSCQLAYCTSSQTYFTTLWTFFISINGRSIKWNPVRHLLTLLAVTAAASIRLYSVDTNWPAHDDIWYGYSWTPGVHSQMIMLMVFTSAAVPPSEVWIFTGLTIQFDYYLAVNNLKAKLSTWYTVILSFTWLSTCKSKNVLIREMDFALKEIT